MCVYMVEVGEKGLKDEKLFERIKKTSIPVLLLLNKIDLVDQDDVSNQIEIWKKLVPNAEILPISALNKFNIQEILDRILELLPVCQAYYEKDAITDKSERFFVEEKIRKNFKTLQKEIPYSVQIEVEEFFEEEDIIRINKFMF